MYSYYSVGEKVKNGVAWIYTKVLWRKARLIRLPIYARNKKNIAYGYNLRISANDKEPSIFIGDNVIIGDYCHIEGRKKITIGDNTLIASRVFITDTSHGDYSDDEQSDPSELPNKRKPFYKNVKVGKNVWIGENVSILAGVEIGDRCIIGANSVVTKSIKDNRIVIGIPVKAIKCYDEKHKEWRLV